MRRTLCLLAMLAACDQGASSKREIEPVAKTKAPKVAVDPWSDLGDGGLEQGSDDPRWVHDPPRVLRDKILAVNAHLIVLKSSTRFAEYRDVLSTVENTPGVIAAEPFIFVELEARSATHAASVAVVLKGVDPQRAGRILQLASRMKSGTLSSIDKGELVIGDDLARTLGVGVGDRVTLATPTDAKRAAEKVFRIGGTFHIDMDEYDERLTLTSLATVQAMLGRDDVMGVEATVRDLDRSGDLARAIETKLGGPPYQVQDWYELNRKLFTALYGDRRP